MTHLEIELPKRELWGWFFAFFFSAALENSLISCQMTAIVFATQVLRNKLRDNMWKLCHHEFAQLEAASRLASHAGDSEDTVFQFGRVYKGFLEEVESENSRTSCWLNPMNMSLTEGCPGCLNTWSQRNNRQKGRIDLFNGLGNIYYEIKKEIALIR